MKKGALQNNKTNLATLCLDLYDDIKEYCAGRNSYSIKPMPKDEAFEKELEIRGRSVLRIIYSNM